MTKDELKKEAEEYADWFWGASPSMMKALANAYIKGAEPREKRIAELEKENAELKKLKRECETSLCRAEYQYNYEQLTKAKNLLQKVADVCGYPNYDIPVVLYSEIADFLKDSEVEK